MSQAKVDQYKKSKSNRKKEVKKQRIQRMFTKIGVSFLGIVLVGWIGYSIYSEVEARRPVESIEVKYDAVNDYMNSLMSTQEASDAIDTTVNSEDPENTENPENTDTTENTQTSE